MKNQQGAVTGKGGGQGSQKSGRALRRPRSRCLGVHNGDHYERRGAAATGAKPGLFWTVSKGYIYEDNNVVSSRRNQLGSRSEGKRCLGSSFERRRN